MNSCTFYNKNEIGSRYATQKNHTILTEQDSELTEDDQKLKQALLAFERHYFDCDACYGRLRAEQHIHQGFDQLSQHPNGLRFIDRIISKRYTSSRTSTLSRWLPLAASVLLISTLSLALWLAALHRQEKGIRIAEQPETVAQVAWLQPAQPKERSGDQKIVQVANDGQSFLLAVTIPGRIPSSDLTGLRILDEDNRERWQSDQVPLDPSGKLLVYVGSGTLENGTYRLIIRYHRGSEKEERKVVFPFILTGEFENGHLER